MTPKGTNGQAPLRVLFVSRYGYPDGPGGGQSSGRAIALAVAKAGCTVRFACMREGLAAPVEERDGALNVVRYPYNLSGPRRYANLWPTFRQLRDIIRKEAASFKPDVVHLLNFDSIVYGAQECARLGIPCVTTVNGPGFFCGTRDGVHSDGSPCTRCDRMLRDCLSRWGPVRGMAWWLYNQWLFPQLRRAYRRIGHFLPISTQMGQGLLSMGVPPERITVMHNPIDVMTKKVTPAMIPGVDDVGARGRATKGAGANDAFVLFYAGRVAKDKNLAQVVRALSHTPVDVTLVVAGEGEDVPALKQLARSLGVEQRVVFVGQVPHERIWGYYARCDAIVLPSLFLEPFSRMAIEGMACGKPAILSDRGGNAETGRDGVSIFNVPPHDDALMASRINTLARNKATRLRMGKAAQAWVRAELSSSRQGKRFAEIYSTLVRT